MYISWDFFEKIQNLKSNWEYDKALEMVNSVLCDDPNNEDALFEVADILYLKWDIISAEKPIDFLLKHNNNDPMSYYVKGVFQMEKTNWSEAKKHLKISLMLSEDDNPEMLRCYWLCEYWSWNRQKWIDFLESAFTVSNKLDAEIIYNLIETYLLEHDYSKVKSYIEYYNNYRDKLNFFEKDVNFYDEKISLFNNFLKTI